MAARPRATVGCAVNMYRANTTPVIENSLDFNPTSIFLNFRMSQRDQILLAFKGIKVPINDIISPVFEWMFELPPQAFSSPPQYLEAYLSDYVLPNLGTDDSIVDYLKPRITDFAINMVEKRLRTEEAMGGFVIMVDLGVLKVDYIGEEQVCRLTPELMEMDHSDLLLGCSALDDEWLMMDPQNDVVFNSSEEKLVLF